MAHEFKITDGDYYVSKSGSNANPGTADLPFLTIEYALSQAASGNKIVVGTGVYEEYLTSGFVNNTIQGDGVVTLSGDGVTTTSAFGKGYIAENLMFTNYINIVQATNDVKFISCIINGGLVESLRAGTSTDEMFVSECVFINSEIRKESEISTVDGVAIEKSLFFNTLVVFNKDTESTNIYLDSCYIDADSEIDASGFGDTGGAELFFRACHVADGTITDPDGKISQTSVVTGDPLFLGSPARLELIVAENSPLIGRGYLGVNIGNVRIGDLQNRNSLEWGLNPDTSGNTAFNANSALLLTSGTSSQRKSQAIYLGQKRRSPKLVLNGITDFLNSVPDDNNSLVNPNHLVIRVAFGDTEAAVQAKIDADDYELFRYGERMRVDGGGLYTGESGYDWTDENDLLFSWYAIAPTIRDDYNEA